MFSVRQKKYAARLIYWPKVLTSSPRSKEGPAGSESVNPGRNDPCPCGSGKKYKLCCLKAEMDSLESPAELTWRRVRRALDAFKMAETLLDFVTATYGPVTVDEAWEQFMVWPNENDFRPFSVHSPHIGLFMSWLFHAWAPDPHQTTVEDVALYHRRPTEAFLDLHPRIDPLVRRYLAACLEAPFSFHEVISSESGLGFRARDVFTGGELEVTERSASQTLQPHDILFGQLVPIDGIVMLESCSPFGLTPDCKLLILDMRDAIRAQVEEIKAKEVREYELEVRELYLSLVRHVLEPKRPELRNTDREPLVLQRLVFEIDSAERAFEALKHLAQGASEGELASAIERTPQGELRRAEIPWTKRGNTRQKNRKNIVLGYIRIEDQRLVCEVNSVKRARKLRALIERSLGEHAHYRATEIQSVERLLSEAQDRPRKRSETGDESAELMTKPEVQAQLRAMFAAHYEDWASERLPALGDRTPLEAVRSPGGRERVEALLVDIERRSAGLMVPPDPATFRRLRERLGLLAEDNQAP